MDDEVTICRSDALLDSRAGVRFSATYMGRDVTLFFIRYEGRVHGYLNRCAHADIELDETPGQFFDRAGEFLICSSHGALYAPENGRCVAGPCRGARLRPVVVIERTAAARAGAREGDVPDAGPQDVSMVYWLPDDAIRPVVV